MLYLSQSFVQNVKVTTAAAITNFFLRGYIARPLMSFSLVVKAETSFLPRLGMSTQPRTATENSVTLRTKEKGLSTSYKHKAKGNRSRKNTAFKATMSVCLFSINKAKK